MKRFFLGFAAFLALLTILFSGYILFTSQFSEVPLSDITFSKDSHKIVLKNIERRTENGSLALRLTDGKDQFFPGNFNFSFGNDRRLYAYGDVGEGDDLRRYIYIITELDGVKEIDATSVGGPISLVTESPDGLYFIIEFETGGITDYCISVRDVEAKIDCERIATTAETKTIWNPKKQHHAIFQFDEDYKEIDMWDTKPVTYEEGNDGFEEIDTAFKNYRVYDSWKEGIYSVGIGYLAMPSKEHFRLPYFIPGDSSGEAAWFYDYNHIIVKGDSSLYIYEINSKKKSAILEGQDLSSSELLIDTANFFRN